MRLFILLLFIFLFSFSTQAKKVMFPDDRSLVMREVPLHLPWEGGDIDFGEYLHGNIVNGLSWEERNDLYFLQDKIRNAVGIIAVPGFGTNVLGSGFFVTGKLFVADFLTVDQLRRDDNTTIAIWIKDQYFAVKRAYALYGARNLAVLEIESVYEGGVLELSAGESLAQVMYGAGFDMREMYFSGENYYITGDEILEGLTKGEASRLSTDKLLNIMQVTNYQSLSGYQFFQLNRAYLHPSTNGLPFLNYRGEVVGVKFDHFTNLAYATPIKFLKEVLNGKGNCGELSLEDCLGKAVEDLYEQAKAGDPIAQYAHNHRLLYTAYLDEIFYRGHEAMGWLYASANAGNVLSQLYSALNVSLDYECFALPEGQVHNIFSMIDSSLRALGRMFSDKEKVVELTLKWLDEMEARKFVLADYLKGLMLLNGNCVEKDVAAGLFHLRKASQRGLAPIEEPYW